MPKSYKISSNNEYVIVTIDESGAYIIKDMAGRKVFLSKYQAKLIKFGIDNILKQSDQADNDNVKVEEIQ